MESKLVLLSRNSSSNFFAMSDDGFVVMPTKKHTASIIFLHGLGENGENWSITLSKLVKPNVKIICPNSTKIPLSLNKGFLTAAWFDLHHLDEHIPEDETSIVRAMDYLHGIIDDELAASKIPANKIILGGFSQGGALALYSSLFYPKRLGGILIMSSWVPLHKTIHGEASNNTNIPILHCHGTDDPIIPYKWGKITADIMNEMNPKYNFVSYEGLKHHTNEEELQEVKNFINKVLP
ncbi:acyl-protein thioesterase 2-like isoform X2 [Daktulosphaira vitifoliae]|uniref:acyl-protein thioesterase 2-like isoform X2 n=1 Tax=Daktulosphaira vitifoliae TaxID=58002 RepID=UPI0021AA61A2|nr:acyl-protein thioesterase 2-like isoform X2 [Daktulosphaira vitifoliae]